MVFGYYFKYSRLCKEKNSGDVGKRKKIVDWIAYQEIGIDIGAQPVELEEIQRKSKLGLDLMGGELNWNALEGVAEYLEITDYELFIDNLIIFKNYQDSK